MKRYSFFEFNSGEKMASKNGYIKGMVDRETGEIMATQTFGFISYFENYHLNVNDNMSLFAHTLNDKIILKAKEALKERN